MSAVVCYRAMGLPGYWFVDMWESRGGDASDSSICVWHPTAGFVVFEASQSLQVADLLQAPARSAADWNLARPGIVFNTKLSAVIPNATPTVESLLDEGREDIGSRGEDWSELPPRKGEPSGSSLPKLGSRAVLGAAAAGQAMANALLVLHSPHSFSGGGSSFWLRVRPCVSS